MKPGKELDRLIQLKVFKSMALWDVRKELIPVAKMITLDEAKKFMGEEGMYIVNSTYIPAYSTDLEQTKKLIKELTHGGVHFVLTFNGEMWEASLGDLLEHKTGTSESPAHAICLAALEFCK